MACVVLVVNLKIIMISNICSIGLISSIIGSVSLFFLVYFVIEIVVN